MVPAGFTGDLQPQVMLTQAQQEFHQKGGRR
jgi:hypothetical protein